MTRRLQVQKKFRAPMFSPFSRLPTELRDKIWFYALPAHGRIIELFLDRKSPYPASSISSARCDIKVTSPTKAPVLLYVNQDSRNETKRHYKALDLGPGFYFPVEILVDLNIDSIYLSTFQNPLPVPQPTNMLEPAPSPSIDISLSPQLQRLKTLAIDAAVWSHLSLSFLKNHHNLKSLTISFQKTTLQDIKPASKAETLTFMSNSLYFSDKNWYTKGIFYADRNIRMKALEALGLATYFVMRSFRPKDLADQSGEEDKLVGTFKGQRTEEESWKGSFGAPSNVYEIEVEERIVDLQMMVALYPRESKFESLKPRFNIRDPWE